MHEGRNCTYKSSLHVFSFLYLYLSTWPTLHELTNPRNIRVPPPGTAASAGVGVGGTEEDTVRPWGTSVPFIQEGPVEDIVFQPQIITNPFIRNFSNSQAHRQKSKTPELVNTPLDPHLQTTAVCLFQFDLPSTEPLFSLFCPQSLHSIQGYSHYTIKKHLNILKLFIKYFHHLLAWTLPLKHHLCIRQREWLLCLPNPTSYREYPQTLAFLHSFVTAKLRLCHHFLHGILHMLPNC